MVVRALAVLAVAILLTGCGRSSDEVDGRGMVAEPILLSDAAAAVPVGLSVDVLEDPTGALTIDDVTSPAYAAQFRPTPVADPNFGFPTGTVWLRIPIRLAAASRADWYIGSPYDTVDRVTLYQPDGSGGFSALVAGYDIPFVQWPVQSLGTMGPHFPLALEPGQEATIYLSLRSQGRVNAAFHIDTEAAMVYADDMSLFRFALIGGGLAILGLFNLLLGIWQRDRDHLLLAAFVGVTFLRVLLYVGDRLIWPEIGGRFDVIGPASIAVYMLLFLLFTIHLLDTRRTVPRFHRVLLMLMVVFGVAFLLTLTGDRRPVTMALFLLLPATFALTSLMSFRMWRRGSRDGLLFFLATLPLLIFVSLETIPSFRFPFASSVGAGLSGPGITLAALFLSVAVAERVNQSRRVAEQTNADLQRANARLDEANRQLDDERARFATILDDQVDGIIRFRSDGVLIFANRAYTDFYGEPPQGEAGVSAFYALPQALSDRLDQLFETMTPENPLRTIEAVLPDREGVLCHRRAIIRGFFDEAGQLTELQTITRDVTDEYIREEALRRGREELEQAHAQYAAILNDQTEGIARFRPDGETLFVNEAFCGFYGGTPATRIGANLFDTMAPETLYAVRAMIAAINIEAPIAIVEREFPDDAGRLVWRRYAIRGFFDEAGHPVEYQSTTIDTSEERRKDEELRRYRDELEQLVTERTAQLEQTNDALQREIRNADNLRRIAYAFSSSLDSRTVLEVILREIKHARPHDAGVRLVLLDESGLVTAGTLVSDMPGVTLAAPYRMDDPGATAGWPALQAIRSGETVVFHDLRQWPAWAGRELYPDWRSAVSVPLRVDGRLLGSLTLVSDEPSAYQPQDIEMIEALAHHAGLAIINAMRFEQSKQLAAVAERERISRDLHDSVTQTLFSASIIAQTLPLQLEQDPDVVPGNIERLGLLTQGALSEMRILLAEMRPTTLIGTDLKTLLGYLASAVMSRSSIRVEVESTGQVHRLPDDVHVAVYRIAQEALNNVVKHSGATTCEVELHQEADGLLLRITDDGQGFDPAKRGNGTLGMTTMNERAQAVGALLTISSSPDRGTEVSLIWGSNSQGTEDAAAEPSAKTARPAHSEVP